MDAPAAVLSTPRLILRPVAPVDGPELLALFQDPAVRRYLLDDMLVDEAWVAEEVTASVARFSSGSGGLWAVRVAAGPDTIVGFAGFRPFFEPPELQLVYGLLPGSWGLGYATEAAAAVIAFAFDELGFEAVVAATDLPNTASVRVMERLGMVRDRVTEQGTGGTVFYRLARASQSSR